MRKVSFFTAALLIVTGWIAYPVMAANLTSANMDSALKQALTVGAERVTTNLGKTGGFNLDPKVHIPLPPTLQKVDKALGMVGMGNMTDDLETRINSAAEASMPKAKTLFVSAIKKMTITDAKAILNGPNDSATQYLKKSMTPELTKEMQPIVEKSLAQSGAMKSYDQVMGQYSQLPFVSGVKGNLTNYAIDKTIAGVFYYVAKEEAAIRTNPAARSTELLKSVFSSIKK